MYIVHSSFSSYFSRILIKKQKSQKLDQQYCQKQNKMAPNFHPCQPDEQDDLITFVKLVNFQKEIKDIFYHVCHVFIEC